MNIALEAAREYLLRSGKTRVWPAHLSRTVDAHLSLIAQRIMDRVRTLERDGKATEAERVFREEMKLVGVAAAKEIIANGS